MKKIKLLRFYEFSSITKINPRFKINHTKTSLWKPLESIVRPDIDKWTLSDLDQIEEIDMSKFVERIKTMRSVTVENEWKTEYTVTIVLCACSIVSLVLYFVGRYFGWSFKETFCKKKVIRSTTESGVEEPLQEPVKSESESVTHNPHGEAEKGTETIIPNYNIYPRV